MAESKNFGKVFQRTMTRTKEKVLRNLGKADVTVDDCFEMHNKNFTEQQAAATKLYKKLKNYCLFLKEMSQTTSSMYHTMKELYDPTWIGYTEFCDAFQDMQPPLDNHIAYLHEKVLTPINAYMAVFPDLKAKIVKREHKLTDYDSARHNYDSIVAKKTPDPKLISNASDTMHRAMSVYSKINTDLCFELESLYNCRVNVLSTAFNELINADLKYYEEASKCKLKMSEPLTRLSQESTRYGGSGRLSHGVDNIQKDDSSSTQPPQATVPPSSSSLPPSSSSLPPPSSSIPRPSSSIRPPSSSLPPPSSLPSPAFKSGHDGHDDDDKKVTTQNHDVIEVITETKRVSQRSSSSSNNRSSTSNQKVVLDDKSLNINGPTLSDNTNKDDVIITTTTAYNDVVINGPQQTSVIVEQNNFSKEVITSNDDNHKVHEINGSIEAGNNKAHGDDVVIVVKHGVTNHDANIPVNKYDEKISSNKEDDVLVETMNDVDSSCAPCIVDNTAAAKHDAQQHGTTEGGGGPRGGYKGVVPTFVPAERILFKVEATNKYVGEDTDELSFDVGDIITVVPFDDPEEQDEGWLMGIMEDSKQKGVFPQNFTKRID